MLAAQKSSKPVSAPVPATFEAAPQGLANPVQPILPWVPSEVLRYSASLFIAHIWKDHRKRCQQYLLNVLRKTWLL